MRFAVGKESITPQWPIQMAGYTGRTSPSIGVHDLLYSKVLLLDDGLKKVMFISLDLCMIDRVFVFELKKEIQNKHSLNGEDILVHTIHTHSGPVSFLDEVVFATDHEEVIKYREFLKQKILRSVDACMSSSFEGTLSIGKGETYIGMSRRQKTINGFQIGPDPQTPIDRSTHTLVIHDMDHNIKAILFSCPCHPVVLYPQNLLISADYPGAACRELEHKFPGSAAIFFAGAGADINPAILVADHKYRDTFMSDVEFTGKVLANDVCNIMRCGMKKVMLALKTHLGEIMLPLGDFKIKEFENMLLSDNERTEEYAKKMLKKIDSMETPKECGLQCAYIELSDDVRIIALEGEICNQIGVNIKSHFEEGASMVFGLTNGWVSYIPTKKILNEGGYEAQCAYTKSGLPGAFAENTEEVIIDYIKKLIWKDDKS